MAKSHNHTNIDDIEKILTERGARFTDQRKLVFKIISKSKKPITAYEILSKMEKDVENVKPPQAYRAIDFLIEQGLIHKIESLNSFVSCHAGHHHAGSQFMVCDSCGTVEEVHLCDLPQPLQKRIDQKGFQLSRWNAELHGICHDCQT